MAYSTVLVRLTNVMLQQSMPVTAGLFGAGR